MPSASLTLKRRPLRLESLEVRRMMALVPELVADLNTFGLGSEPASRIVEDDRLIFTAKTPGTHLFVTDGTETGTTLLTSPNVQVRGLGSVATINSRHYFEGGYPSQSTRIWSTDGTPEGTRQEAILLPGTGEPSIVGAVNGRLLFTQWHDGQKRLWSVAQGESSPVKIADFEFDPTNSQTLTSEFVFFETIAGHQRLWRTDGTAAGTRAVGHGVGTPEADMGVKLAKLGDAAFFVGYRVNVGLQIWRYDGTLKAISDFTSEQSYSVHLLSSIEEDALYAQVSSSGGIRPGVWRSNGGVDDLEWWATSLSTPSRIIQLPNETVAAVSTSGSLSNLYRRAAESSGWELLAKDVKSPIIKLDELIAFVKSNELWTTDGTLSGTQYTGVRYVTNAVAAVGEKLAISVATDTSVAEFGIWEPGAASPSFVIDINPSTRGSAPWQMTSAGDFIYALATDDRTPGYGLWKLDTDSRSAVKLTQFSNYSLEDCGRLELIHPDSFLQAVGDGLYFASDFGKELWYTDGTPEGTALLRTFDQRIEWMNDIDGTLVFDVTDAEHGRELWTSDGTPEGTRIVVDMNVFKAHDHRLWRSDGTPEGTYALTDFGVAVTFWSQPMYLEGQIYFRSGDHLYRTDGTIPGTIQFQPNFPTTEVVGGYRELIATASRQYLWSQGAGKQKIWWTSDYGATMHFVAELPAGVQVSYYDHHATLGEVVLFPLSNHQYYRTDGTAEGTYRLPAAERAENGFFQPVEFLEVQGQLLYQKDNRLWRTDGTVEGSYAITAPVTMLGAGGQKPSYIAHRNGLFVTTGVPAPGMEVYEMIGLPGDTNFDGQVDLTDLNNVRNHFGETGNVLGDSNGDGVVDLEDLNAVRNNFGADGATSSTVAPGVVRSGKPMGVHPAAARETSAAWQDMLFVSDTASASQKTTAKRLKALDRVFASL
jgi:ELWxxDGT repeat protein